MRLTVLGKYGPYPKAGGATSGYLLTDGCVQVLLDIGSGVLSRLQSLIPPEHITLVISHCHPDHIADLPLLKYYFDAVHTPRPVTLYAPSGLPPVVLEHNRFEYISIKAGTNFNIGSMRFTVHPASHAGEAYFFSILCEGKKFIYTGDTRVCASLLKECETADIILCDVGTEEFMRTKSSLHLSGYEAGQLAKMNNAQLILTHFHPNHSQEKQLADARLHAENVIIAEELAEYDF